MEFCSVIMFRAWKITLKTAVGILTLFATVFILSLPVDAVIQQKTAVIRASDGHVYKVQYTQPLSIENFAIQGLNGEVLSREIAVELYLAAGILNRPPTTSDIYSGKELVDWVHSETKHTAKWKNYHRLATIVGSASMSFLVGVLASGLEITASLIQTEAVQNAVQALTTLTLFVGEEQVMSEAYITAWVFAERAFNKKRIFDGLVLLAENGTEISIEEIKWAYNALLQADLYVKWVHWLMKEYLILPDRQERLVNFVLSVSPLTALGHFFASAGENIEDLRDVRTVFHETGSQIETDVSASVDTAFGETRKARVMSTLARAGFYDRKPVEVQEEIADEWLWLPFEEDYKLLDLTNKFSDPNGDPFRLSLKEGVTDENVAIVKKTTFTVFGEQKAREVLAITPIGLGETLVTVVATETTPFPISVEQTFKVVVAPANSPPQIIKTLSAQTLALGSSSPQLDLGTYFIDLDSASISYTAQSNNTAVATVQRTGSVITISAIGIGDATITVTATDSDSSSTDQTFSVTVTDPPVQNRAPRVSSQIPAHALTVGNSAALLPVSSYFNDPDGDTLTYTSSTSHAAVVTASTSGSPVLITPVAAGTATITVTASDGKLTATQSFTVTVTDPPVQNRAPRVSSQIPAHALTVGNSAARLSVSDYFNDPDGDTLTYTSSTSQASRGNVSSSGSPVLITPVAAGTATITVTASDGKLQATQSFTATITAAPLQNQAPEVINAFNPQSFRVGDAPKWRNLSSYFSDPDNNTLTYTATSSNNGIVAAIISGNSVKITPGEPGTARVTITAQDTGGLTVTQSFTVTVQAKLQTVPSLPVCDRTPQVRDEIMKRTGDNNCANVTEDELESITRLSLIEAGLTTLKQGDFDELRNLEDLVLNENSLRTFPEDVFWYLGELEYLGLKNNQITTLVKDTFEHLDSLTALTLYRNQITTLQEGAFNDLDNLIELDLHENQLTTLPAGVFEDLSSLEELTLEDNRIAILSRGGFLGLSSLEDLYLDGNPIHTIRAGAFNGLSNLTELDFNNSSLHTIEVGAFSGLSSLTDLELYDTQLNSLPRNVFSGLSSLTDLGLAGNPLHTIEVGAFSGLSSLTDLDLSDAQLSSLPRNVFSGLSSLTDLNLDENPIQTIEVGAFSGLSSLTDLDLDDAQLRTLRRDVFSGLSSLEKLDLYGNALRTIEVGAFNGLSNLISLSLDENQLTALPQVFSADSADWSVWI